MNKNDKYREYIINTLSNTTIYTEYQQNKVLSRLKEMKIIKHIKDSKLIDIIRDNEEHLRIVISELEKQELLKPYGYCFLYVVKNPENIKNIKEHNKFQEIFNTRENDGIMIDSINTDFSMPKLFETEKNTIIKFSYILTNGDTPPIKIPVMCDFLFNGNEILLRIAFDILPVKFQTENFYVILSNKVEKWLLDNLQIELINFISFQAAENLLEYKMEQPLLLEYVTEYSEYSNDSLQGNLRLRANNNEELPLIAELREIISKFDSDRDKKLMDFFFTKLKTTSNYYQRGLKWHLPEDKTLVIEFKKNYMESNKVLVHFHNNNLPKESIDYVIRDLAKYRDLSKLRVQNKE